MFFKTELPIAMCLSLLFSPKRMRQEVEIETRPSSVEAVGPGLVEICLILWRLTHAVSERYSAYIVPFFKLLFISFETKAAK